MCAWWRTLMGHRLQTNHFKHVPAVLSFTGKAHVYGQGTGVDFSFSQRVVDVLKVPQAHIGRSRAALFHRETSSDPGLSGGGVREYAHTLAGKLGERCQFTL